MQNLKQKLNDQGLVGSLVLRESGGQIGLRFARGEMSKMLKVTLGPVSMDVELRLEEVPGAGPDQPNLRLVLVNGGAPAIEAADTSAADAAALADAVKAEAEAKLKDEAAKLVEAQKADAEAADAAEAKAKADAAAAAPQETTNPSAPQPTGGKKR